MYRIQPAGLAPWVDVELILFDVPKQKSTEPAARSSALHWSGDGQSLIASLCVLALLGSVAW